MLTWEEAVSGSIPAGHSPAICETDNRHPMWLPSAVTLALADRYRDNLGAGQKCRIPCALKVVIGGSTELRADKDAPELFTILTREVQLYGSGMATWLR